MAAPECSGASRKPSTASKKAQTDLEQTLHIANVFFIDQEQDHMVACRDLGSAVGDQHFFVTDNRADGGAGRQLDVGDRAADHLARLGITVGNCLNGLGSATSQ